MAPEDFVWCALSALADRDLWTLVHFWRRRHDADVLMVFFDELYADARNSTVSVRSMCCVCVCVRVRA